MVVSLCSMISLEVSLKFLTRCRPSPAPMLHSAAAAANHRLRLARCCFHTSSIYCKRRKTAEERKAPRIIEYSPKAKPKNLVDVWKNMTVQDLAQTMGKDLDHVFEVFSYVKDSRYYDSPSSVIDNMIVIQETVKKSGFRPRHIAAPSNEKSVEQKVKDATKRPPAAPEKLVRRPPVVTVMGHVDHGKTTLLDSLRHTRVVDGEFGGITQHIGAFSVKLPNTSERITFLDTPGHAAFTAMRARGADATDIVVLVVAADDGVMEQTIESIRMAREAQVPIIVAINKMDKPTADLEATQRMLATQGLVVEGAGGEVQAVPISALKGTNLDSLVESIALQAEIMDLKAEPSGLAEGLVIESKTDPHRGKLSTALVQRGTLRRGSVLVAGTAWAKVRAMFDDAGRPVTEAPPATPVEVLGWRELPSAGDEILEVESEKVAHEVIKYRQTQKQLEKQEDSREAILAKAEEHRKVYRAALEAKWKKGRFKVRRTGPREKESKGEYTGPALNILVKGDVWGSVEAILDVLETYDCSEDCRLSLIHYGVGNLTENDVELAVPFKGLVYLFNVDAPATVKQLAKQRGVTIKPHNVIYRMVKDLQEEISLRLPPKPVEEVTGEANVLQHFTITDGKKKVAVAGSRCTKGSLKKGSQIRLLRNQEIVYEGVISALKHLKEDVDSVKKDVECGVRLDDPTLEFKPGDVLQTFLLRDEAQVCSWDPGF